MLYVVCVSPGIDSLGFFIFFFINTESGKKKEEKKRGEQLPKDPRPLDYHNLTSVV